MPTEEDKKVAYKIVDFYNSKFGHAGGQRLEELGITDIHVQENGVDIHLRRPGLLIGFLGSLVDALSTYLGMKIIIHESYDWDSILNPEPLDI